MRGPAFHLPTETIRREAGDDIGSGIQDALDDGHTTILVEPSPSGGAYRFDNATVAVDLDNYDNGVNILVRPTVKVEGDLDSLWFDFVKTDATTGRVENACGVWSTRFDGRNPFFEYDGVGDPVGFFRSTDVLGAGCNVSTENFSNSSTDSTVIEFRNDDSVGWSEQWFAGGLHRQCDRALDFTDIDGSTPSFRDGTIGIMRAHGKDFCVRLSRNHRGLSMWNLAMFPKANNCDCLVLDGNHGGSMLGGMVMDDTDGYTGTTAVATGPQYISSEGPILYGVHLNNIDTAFSGNDPQDDVWEMFATGGYMGRRRFSARDNGGPEHRFYRTGQMEVVDDAGNVMFEIAADGDLRNPSAGMQINDRPRIVDGWRVPQNDGTNFLFTDEFEIYMSDGTDGNAQGDIVAKVDVGGTELTEVISQRSNQT